MSFDVKYLRDFWLKGNINPREATPNPEDAVQAVGVLARRLLDLGEPSEFAVRFATLLATFPVPFWPKPTDLRDYIHRVRGTLFAGASSNEVANRRFASLYTEEFLSLPQDAMTKMMAHKAFFAVPPDPQRAKTVQVITLDVAAMGLSSPPNKGRSYYDA